MLKLLNAYSYLDLDPTTLNIELVRAIFIYYNVFQFRVAGFFLSYLVNTNTQTNTETRTHARTDSNEYSIVAFENATIINCVNMLRE